MFNFFMPSDKKIEKKYLSIGESFGEMVSYLNAGKPCFFEETFEILKDLEKEYSDRGYRTISIDDFIDYGGYGKPISHLVGIKRDIDETPVLHTKLYEEMFTPNKNVVID